MSERGVKNLDFWKSLCANGIKPPTNKAKYLESVQKHLYKELGVERQECSEATYKDIDKQASNFCKSAVYNWSKAGRSYPRMEKRKFLLEKTISVEVVQYPMIYQNWQQIHVCNSNSNEQKLKGKEERVVILLKKNCLFLKIK